MRHWPWVVLVGVLVTSLTAPWLAPYDPLAVNLAHNLAPPSLEHPLGTDLLGRDILSRLLHGGRHSLSIAGFATLISVLGGLALGLASETGPHGLRPWAVALTDSLLALPSLLVALMTITLLEPNRASIALAVGLGGIGPFARTAADAIRAGYAAPYILSAVSIGARPRYILWQYILRNAQGVLLSFAGVVFAWNLLNSAALSFLGFVGAPDTPDWGVMLAAGRGTFAQAPWQALSAGVVLTLVTAAVQRLAASPR